MERGSRCVRIKSYGVRDEEWKVICGLHRKYIYLDPMCGCETCREMLPLTGSLLVCPWCREQLYDMSDESHEILSLWEQANHDLVYATRP